MVLIGYRQWLIVLGAKLDECQGCGIIGRHMLVRITWWGTLFFIPVVLLFFKHAMVCENCGKQTGISWLRMRRGLKDGRLPLERPRPRFEGLPPDPSGHKPSQAEYFDPVQRNPKRSLAGWYFVAWPVAVVLFILFLAWAAVFY